MARKDKYSTDITRASATFIPASVPESHAALIRASLSTSSWNKHLSAIHCFNDFRKMHKINSPLQNTDICNFINFVLNTKKLRHSTAKSYVSSLEFYLKLQNLDSSCCNDLLVKSMLKGAENLELYNEITKNCRRAMSFPLLKILSHCIASKSWPELDKQCFWTAFTVAFYGSFRFGELVSESAKSYNKKETLLWSDVVFGNDFAVIHIKISKNKIKKGEYIDLFLQKDNHYCPVKALLRLKKLTDTTHNTPVFRLTNGELLTSSRINTTLYELLLPVIGETAKLITGHSFRAALASALATRPDIASSEEVQAWGRWSSNSFLLYTRLKLNQKRIIFNKIVSVLKN
jgi:hypothetical protein